MAHAKPAHSGIPDAELKTLVTRIAQALDYNPAKTADEEELFTVFYALQDEIVLPGDRLTMAQWQRVAPLLKEAVPKVQRPAPTFDLGALDAQLQILADEVEAQGLRLAGAEEEVATAVTDVRKALESVRSRQAIDMEFDKKLDGLGKRVAALQELREGNLQLQARIGRVEAAATEGFKGVDRVLAEQRKLIDTSAGRLDAVVRQQLRHDQEVAQFTRALHEIYDRLGIPKVIAVFGENQALPLTPSEVDHKLSYKQTLPRLPITIIGVTDKQSTELARKYEEAFILCTIAPGMPVQRVLSDIRGKECVILAGHTSPAMLQEVKVKADRHHVLPRGASVSAVYRLLDQRLEEEAEKLKAAK